MTVLSICSEKKVTHLLPKGTMDGKRFREMERNKQTNKQDRFETSFKIAVRVAI